MYNQKSIQALKKVFIQITIGVLAAALCEGLIASRPSYCKIFSSLMMAFAIYVWLKDSS